MASPWVERNLDGAQYEQPRGSQYEGPNYFYLDGEREYHDRELDEWRERAIVTSPSVTTSLGWTPNYQQLAEALGYIIATLIAVNLIRHIGPILNQLLLGG